MLLDFLCFRQKPVTAQFAKEGAWEQAWSWPSAVPPTAQALADYLGESRELAFEAFFGGAFVGVRYCGERENVRRFAAACIQAAAQAEDATALLYNGLAEFGVSEQWARHFAFAEIGAVNAWKSVGAFRIEDVRLAHRNFADLWDEVSISSVGRDRRYHKAIEFAFLQPVHHWIALPLHTADAPFEICAESLCQTLAYLDGAA